ncbi:unnamed protein product [Prunus armeniaca]
MSVDFMTAFNGSITDARDAPILTLLTKTHKKKSAWCILKLVGERKYEVINHGLSQVVVDLARHSCACRQWDIRRISCKHACATIGQRHGDHFQYVVYCYKKEAYMKAYNPIFHPMTSQDLWLKSNLPPLLPPKDHKHFQPRKKRIPSAGEAERFKLNGTKLQRHHTEIKCSICKQEGHNKRKYPNREELMSK